LTDVSADVGRLTTEQMVLIEHAQAIKDNLNVVARGARNIALMADPADRQAELKRIDDMLAKNTQHAATLAGLSRDDDDKALLADYTAAQKPYDAMMKQALDLGMAGNAADATTMLIKKVRPLQTASFKAIDALITHQDKQMRDSAVAIDDLATRASWWMLGAAIVSALLSALTGWGVTRSVVGPLRQAVDVARTVANGDLSSHIEVTSTDEAGQLLQAMKTMNESLGTIVSQVRQSSDSIATGAGQIATGNADLSQRTEEQASSLQQTAASMEELTGTVQASADTARQANVLASAGIAAAQRGGESVTQVVATMNEIAASSKKVAEIIAVIDGIAFQTNILALNAAVEAARAGEQGRGFAVVAGEVRALAQRSANAAREIKSLIGASVDKVEVGARQVDTAREAMDDIVTQVQQVASLISEISAAAVEQSSGIGQIGQAVAQMDQVTQQNAALVEESAAAAESLSQQAKHLTEAVRSFRLAGERVATV
ncbi:MAG: methyl-accepting chemotaxis sensory transducer, partial [Pseudomonadota bacterium]